jgi:hypothetical protein
LQTFLIKLKYSIACINSKLRRFEDTKGVIKIRKSKKDRQDNGQKKKDKKTNNDQKHTHEIKGRVTRTPLKTGG